jgi:tellurite resistance protein TehA-like permease
MLDDLLRYFLIFISCFLIILLAYEMLVVKKAKKNKNKMPAEVKFLVNRYNIDLVKISYNQLLQIVALVSSLDMALIITIAALFDKYFYQILVAIVLIIPVMLISYHFVGNFYKKKGMIKHV